MSSIVAPGSAALAALEAASEGLERLRGCDLGVVRDEDLAELLQGVARIESVSAALRGEILLAAESHGTAEGEGATGTDAWASGLTGDTREVNAGGLRIARLLRERFHHTREAFASGAITKAQMKVIVGAAEQVPETTTPEQLAAAEKVLVGKASGVGTRSGRPMNPKRLRQAARRMLDVVDRELADKHEQILLGREAQGAQRETYFRLHDNGDGTWSGRFTIPETQGAMLNNVLDHLTAPRRLGKDAAGRSVIDESAPDGPGYRPSGWEKRGWAFGELIEHLPLDGWSGTNAATLLIRLDLTALLSGLGVGTLDGGVRITAADARRLACESELVPTVLGGDSVPLDHGRGKRLHDKHQRRALAHLHDTCAITGCERPFAWCEIHHPLPWASGGRTDLDNGLPLCAYHHRCAHDEDFTLSRDPGSGPHAWKLRRRPRPPRLDPPADRCTVIRA